MVLKALGRFPGLRLPLSEIGMGQKDRQIVGANAVVAVIGEVDLEMTQPRRDGRIEDA